MVKAYRILAYLVAFEVIVQATMIAWGFFGFGHWIDQGHVFNKATLNCDNCGFHFAAERGLMIHGINGMMIIPLLSLILLIVSFFAKIPGGVKWAAILFALVIVQSQILPALGHSHPIFGALHGMNALFVFATAVMAGKRVSGAVVGTPRGETEAAAAV